MSFDALGGTYFAGSRNRTPGPLPFESMKMMPAASRALRTDWIVLIRESVSPRSTFLTLISDSFAADARSVCFHPKSARAARICPFVIMPLDKL